MTPFFSRHPRDRGFPVPDLSPAPDPSTLLVVLLLLSGCVGGVGTTTTAPSGPVADRTRVVFLHDNDNHFHGNHRAEVRRFIEGVRRSGNSVFLVSGGDIMVRHPHAWPVPNDTATYRDRGLEIFSWMNEVGYDLAVVGNHELDVHGDVTREILESAQFPLLGANIRTTTSQLPELAPFHVLETPEGLSLAVLGLSIVNFEPIPGLEQDPFGETVQRYLHLAEEHDALLLLTHIGIRDDIDLANTFPELTAIFGGHTNSLLPEALHVNGVLLAQAGGHSHVRDEDGEMFMGVTVLEFEGRTLSKSCGWVVRIGPGGVRPAGRFLRMGEAWQKGVPACPRP